MQKQSFLFSWDSKWPLCDKGLLSNFVECTIKKVRYLRATWRPVTFALLNCDLLQASDSYKQEWNNSVIYCNNLPTTHCTCCKLAADQTSLCLTCTGLPAAVTLIFVSYGFNHVI